MSILLLPYCWIVGHDRSEAEDKPGWFAIDCKTCGRPFNKPYFWQVIRHRIPYFFLWLANATFSNRVPGYKPNFRAIDQIIPGIGTEHACAAYSYEHIAGLIDQYKNDGLPEPLLKDLISEDGWVTIGEDNAEEMLDLINKSFENESNKQEREKTMRIMNGEETK